MSKQGDGVSNPVCEVRQTKHILYLDSFDTRAVRSAQVATFYMEIGFTLIYVFT